MYKRVFNILWKLPLAIIGFAVGVVVLLFIGVVCVLYVPSVRSVAIEKGLVIASEQTGLDIDLDSIYLSPLHHSPMALYRAYRGEADLPLEVRVDSLFVGHRGEDTLIYVHRLRLRAEAKTSQAPIGTDLPIAVERLYLDQTTFHSDSMIAAVGIDALVGLLDVRSPELIIGEGQYPLQGLRLEDADVCIDLRPTEPDTTVKDTVPMKMNFELSDGALRNIHFRLSPIGLDIATRSIKTDASINVGNNRYDARRIDIGYTDLAIGSFSLPIDTVYGDADVDLNRQLILSHGLHARVDKMGAEADLSAVDMSLETMRIDIAGNAVFQGSKAQLTGYYDIDDEAYDMHAQVERVDLSPFLHDSTHVVIAGELDARGKGIDPHSKAMRSTVHLYLSDGEYENINVSGMRLDAALAEQTVQGTLHLPFAMKGDSLRVSARTEHQFRAAQFMTPQQIIVDYTAQMRKVRAHVAGEDFYAEHLDLNFSTDSTTALGITTEGLSLNASSPMHVLRLVEQIQAMLPFQFSPDSFYLPRIQADVHLAKGSPIQHIIDRTGLGFNKASVELTSDSVRTFVKLDAETSAGSVVNGLNTDAGLWFDIEQNGKEWQGMGCLTLDSLSFGEMGFGSRTIDLALTRSTQFANSLRADIRLDDVPLEIVDSIAKMADVDFSGAIRANAVIDGLPNQFDISAQVQPIHVAAKYKPYAIGLSLGDRPVIMEHNRIDLNGIRLYGADSTYLTMRGGLDLNQMKLDVVLHADSFAPAKLPKGGLLPVYGELATDIRGKVSGALDSIIADVDVTVLPITDITYPIDNKNLAQVHPYGTVNVRYALADSVPLNLGGRINVDKGLVRYSPKIYPVMPFKVDSGSNVSFHGGVGQTLINVSASQQVKADVESKGEETRRVDFRTGVRVNGIVDSIGLHSIGFFLEAPNDEAITRELASVDEDTREGLAATLLATGMYVGESNEAAQREGYALSSIVNSRINAALANSKVGKFIDIDFSSAQTNHAVGKTNDMNISFSKSFFKNKLKLTVGTSISDNPEVLKTNGLLNNLSAEYKLTKEGNVLLRVFAQRDYNNVLEGELYKSGIGVRAVQEWRRKELFRGDSINRTYGLTADADVAWRSNNSLGPNLTLKSTMRNLLGKGETLTIKGNGAYYWALRNRHPGDPKKTDTYKLGINTALVFPFLHWTGDHNPEGDTRYMLGYQYENIAGGYGVHKLSGSFTYFIHSSEFITHAFTPFSLSVVFMNAESDSLMDKTAEYPQLIKLIAGNEFVPSIGYNFTYNNYRSKRAVNTMVDLGVKESGNLINAITCLFGYSWTRDTKENKRLYDQFVKLTAELRNKYNFPYNISIATRLFAGVNIPLGNSFESPLSEAFYAGGANGMRAASPESYGAGNFYSPKYNQSFFHAGDLKMEANLELRFPIVWKLFGAAFLDAGNVWNWYNMKDRLGEEAYREVAEKMQLPLNMQDGIIGNTDFLNQIALGTGAGLRLDIEGLVIRLDLGVAIHAPYQTYLYTKDGKPNYDAPISNYFNIPSALDALRLNFGIGYPF